MSMGRIFEILFFVFVAGYIILLAVLIRLFLQNYKDYLCRMDNYYSAEEARRLRWVYLMFWGALGIGILALLSALFMTQAGSIVFSVVYLVYYIFFAIRFIGYPNEFKEIEAAMSNEPPTVNEEGAKLPQGIEEKLQQWVQEKQFLEQGVTISFLAAYIGTNRDTLSSHINQVHKKPFRVWINQLRIKESQQIMLSNPGMPIGDVADKVGIDKSNFSRQFTQAIGLSPNQWLKASVQK
jgi:AraC-like DNA-binding protein